MWMLPIIRVLLLFMIGCITCNSDVMEASLGQFPAMVAVLYDGVPRKYICAASLIAPTFVLSVAVCYGKIPRVTEVKIMGGDVHLQETSTVKDRQEIGVLRITIHPKYDGVSYNFAILELKKLVERSRYFHSIGITSSRPRVHTNCKVAGWDLLNRKAAPLLFTEALVYSDVDCASVPFEVHEQTMFCAGIKEGGLQTIGIDQGGPIICNGKLAGVASQPLSASKESVYGGYSDVSAVSEWIHSILNEKMKRIWLSSKAKGSASPAGTLINYRKVLVAFYATLKSNLQ
ncbi:trypsin-1-like [Hermetia illucens]|uniref:trypsin-1-like n=1 Tax=Hermetia illucens TaxID=343691 RepID=UPI0018CC57C1|nr:trypsin-1-like [Hermetia illucens]